MPLYAFNAPTQATGCKASHPDAPANAESQQACRAARAQSRAPLRVVTRPQSLQPSNVLKPRIAVCEEAEYYTQSHSRKNERARRIGSDATTLAGGTRACIPTRAACVSSLRHCCYNLNRPLHWCNSVLDSHPHRRLGARRAIRMRQQMRSRSRHVGHRWVGHMQHFEL